MKRKMFKKGFTLVELMVVVVIVGILAAVAVPLMSSVKGKAITAEAFGALSAIEDAVRNYVMAYDEVPTDFSDLSDSGLISLGSLDGTYFSAAQIESLVGAGGLPFERRGLGDGSATVMGLTIVKEDGMYKSFGHFDPGL